MTRQENMKDRKTSRPVVQDLEPTANPKGGPTPVYMSINNTGLGGARAGVGGDMIMKGKKILEN